LTVRVSAPETVGVTSSVTLPLPFVSGALVVPELLGSPVTVLPAAELKVTAALGTGLPAESRRLNTNLVLTPDESEDEALVAVSVVPLTLTVFVAFTPPPLAVTVMVRLVGSPSVPSVAVAIPLEFVVAWVTTKTPELAVKITGTPLNALLF
jgi:hypothetical protein